MNSVILIGNLSRDPETRTTQSGVACTTFTLAVNRQFAGKDGKRECDFLNVVAWRNLAEICAKYLEKGSKCCVEGSIQTRTYEAKDGGKRTVTEIIAANVEFLSHKGGKMPDGYTETDEEMPF